MNKADTKSSAPQEPKPVEVEAPDAPKGKGVKRELPIIIKYPLWPLWWQKYVAYMKWAQGNDDRIFFARKKFWMAVAISFCISILWWLRLAILNRWSVDSPLQMVAFFLFVWMSACLPLNIYCVGIGNRPGTFSIPDWRKYLTSNERLHWSEFPLPLEKTFTLGTNGKDWIQYGWYSDVRFIKTGRFVFGDPKYDPENALRYLMLCAASEKTFFVCLDGDPFGGVGFRHLKNLSNCLVYGKKENIIRAVRWLHKEMERRRDSEGYPRIVIVCDQKMMDVYADGWWSETAKAMHYHWYEIRNEMIDILKHGSRFNIFVIGIVAPSDRFTSLHNDMLPFMLAINLFYYQPVTNEKGTIWVEPHPNHFTDVFSIVEGNDRIIGKLPYLPESEQVDWLLQYSENIDETTDALRVKAKHEIPKIKIEKEEPEKEDEHIPLWKRIGMKKAPIEIKPEEQPAAFSVGDQSYQERFAPGSNGKNGTNGKQLEIEEANVSDY